MVKIDCIASFYRTHLVATLSNNYVESSEMNCIAPTHYTIFNISSVSYRSSINIVIILLYIIRTDCKC